MWICIIYSDFIEFLTDILNSERGRALYYGGSRFTEIRSALCLQRSTYQILLHIYSCGGYLFRDACLQDEDFHTEDAIVCEETTKRARRHWRVIQFLLSIFH